jgi:segregation and condensation protein A
MDPLDEPFTDDPLVRVQLDVFEGPLDLLLHLIQKHELDIFDIPISFITERYLSYVKLMQALNLDLAAEYLLMAATLTHIKSRMLLPSPPPDESLNVDPDAEQGEDPRVELVRRLLEYQKFRAAGEELAARGVAGRDVFPRGMEVTAESTGEAPLATFPAIAMIEAFQKLLARRKLSIAHEVTPERISIADRINALVERLRERRSMRFDELFDDDETGATGLVVTFLALLEMTRLRMTRLYQSGNYEQLHVTLVLTEVGDPGAAVRDDWR